MKSRTEDFDFDVAILGGGSAGYAAARTAASYGLRTAVIEGGEDVGGLCILRGCMPTKALLHTADVLHTARKSGLWGLVPGRIRFNFAKVMERKNSLIHEFASHRRQQLNRGQFKFIRAQASFEDPHTLRLAAGKKITSRHFIISTGSVVATPPLPSLANAGYITSDDALRLRKLPKSIIVLGGGAVAVEFAQFFARLDVQVTVIQRSTHLLRDFDDDAASTLETVFRREGIALYTKTQLQSAYRNGRRKGIVFEFKGRKVKVEADEIFHGLGRTANTSSLALAKAGVASERGRIVTNAKMQTSQPHIYAAGDCTGPHEIVHIAIQQGEAAAYNIAHPRHPRKIDYRLLTQVIFTDPQVASVGLTEKEAQARGVPFRTASYPFNDHGKSMIMDALDGFVKLLADPKTGEILGGCVAGPVGGELIHEITAAMHNRMTVHELAIMPHYHPTLAEIWTYPAEELAQSCGQKK